jgi:hypothetical protein
MLRTLAIASSAFLISIGGAQAALTGAELRSEILDREIAFLHKPTGYAGLVRYVAGGSAILWNANRHPRSDSGRWRIVGNRLCVRWQLTRSGEEACFTFLRAGPGMYCTSHRVAARIVIGGVRPFPNCTELVS